MNIPNIKQISQLIFSAILLYFAFKIYGGWYFTILESVNIFIHEAGHFILSFGPTLLHFAGGTLFQLLFPILFFVYFLRLSNYYSSSVMLWWLGQNMTHVGIYMKDADVLNLPLLVEGGIHDWNFMFNYFHIIRYDDYIGGTVWWIGIVIMITSSLFPFFMLFRKSFQSLYYKYIYKK